MVWGLPKIYISSNGCVDGRLSSAYVERFFTMNNCTLTKDSAQADLIVFYACGLLKKTESDSLRILQKLQSTKRTDAKLIVWGCLPKINPRLLAKVYDGPFVDPKNLGFFETVLEKVDVPMSRIHANTLVPLETSERGHNVFRFSRFVANARRRFMENRVYWIHAVKGCTHACSYCSDRCAWERINSIPIDRIISEFKRGLMLGYNRFCLIGSDLGAYGLDTGKTLIDLLARLVGIDDRRDYKIILDQMNPIHLKEMYHELEEIFNSGKIEMLGCQVQSGSNRILQLMGRKYTAEDWMQCMLGIRNRFPKILIQTHFLVGFPTETDEDFRATLSLLDRIFLDKIIIFKFSKRPHVRASYFPGQVPEGIKKSRWRKLFVKAKLNMMIRKIQRSLT